MPYMSRIEMCLCVGNLSTFKCWCWCAYEAFRGFCKDFERQLHTQRESKFQLPEKMKVKRLKKLSLFFF